MTKTQLSICLNNAEVRIDNLRAVKAKMESERYLKDKRIAELEKERDELKAKVAELEEALATSFEFISSSGTAEYLFYYNHKHLIKDQG